LVTPEQYDKLLQRAECFAFTSLQYPDYNSLRSYSLIREGDEGFLLCDDALHPSPIHWSANDAGALISLLHIAPDAVTVPFVPPSFVQPLTHAGFSVLAEFADYFNLHLAETAEKLPKRDLEFLRAEEAEAAARISMQVRGQSRGFMGETQEFFREWMRDNDILCVHANGQIAGFCCVAVYDGGTTLWVRELAVEPHCQGMGYGRRLFENAVLYGVLHGASKGFLAVDLKNDHAIALYERLGFTRRGEDSEIQMVRGEF